MDHLQNDQYPYNKSSKHTVVISFSSTAVFSTSLCVKWVKILNCVTAGLHSFSRWNNNEKQSSRGQNEIVKIHKGHKNVHDYLKWNFLCFFIISHSLNGQHISLFFLHNFYFLCSLTGHSLYSSHLFIQPYSSSVGSASVVLFLIHSIPCYTNSYTFSITKSIVSSHHSKTKDLFFLFLPFFV